MDKDSKKLLILIGAVILVFVIAFSIRFFTSPTGNIVTIDDLHKQNLEGKESENNYVYNGFSFVKTDNLWYTQVQVGNDLIDIPLHFSPRELENISVKGKLDSGFNNHSQIYITFNPTEESLKFVALSSAELSLNIAKGIKAMPVAACDRNKTDACINRPILDCTNTDKAVIYLKSTNSTGIVIMKGNCIELEGNEWELVKAVDRLLYKWYKVMD
jgi:hypothetical protein